MTSSDVRPLRIDHRDYGFMVDPFSVWAELRVVEPVAFSELYGGFWVVTGYREMAEVLHDPVTFCSSLGGPAVLDNPGSPISLLIGTDPPDHRAYRTMLNPELSPQRAAAHEVEVLALVTELIDGFIEVGECDLVDALARPLPQVVLFRLLGVPQEDAGRVREMQFTATRMVLEDPVAAERAGREFMDYLRGLVAGRRAGRGPDDLMQALVDAEVRGELMSDEDVARLLQVVFAGGLNTVKGFLGTTFWYLGEHPEKRQVLIDDRSLLPSAVEEFLRLTSPIHGLFRTATVDVVLGGRQIRAGDKVYVVHGSANRDESVFPDAEECVLDREPNRHLAFGLGIHRCIGSHFARVEITTALEQVLERLPDYRIKPGADIHWDMNGTSRGVDVLPIEFTPGRRSTAQGAA